MQRIDNTRVGLWGRIYGHGIERNPKLNRGILLQLCLPYQQQLQPEIAPDLPHPLCS